MKNEAFNYNNILEWRNLECVYAAVIEHFSGPDRKTLIDVDIEVYRTADGANNAAERAFSGHLTTHEQARVHTYAGCVRRCDLRDDLRDWRADECGEDVPDWLAIDSMQNFFGAYDSDEGREDE